MQEIKLSENSNLGEDKNLPLPIPIKAIPKPVKLPSVSEQIDQRTERFEDLFKIGNDPTLEKDNTFSLKVAATNTFNSFLKDIFVKPAYTILTTLIDPIRDISIACYHSWEIAIEKKPGLGLGDVQKDLQNFCVSVLKVGAVFGIIFGITSQFPAICASAMLAFSACKLIQFAYKMFSAENPDQREEAFKTLGSTIALCSLGAVTTIFNSSVATTQLGKALHLTPQICNNTSKFLAFIGALGIAQDGLHAVEKINRRA